MKNLRMAVAPHDHLRFSDSVVALAGKSMKLLKKPTTIDELKSLFDRKGESFWCGRVDFDKLVLAVTLLYSIGQVKLVDEERIALK